MPTNILLLPLLAGYSFLHLLHYTKFRSKRLDGYRLLLDSAFVGVVLAMMAWGSTRLLERVECVVVLWRNIAPPVPFLGTAVLSLALGYVLPRLINVILSKFRVMTEQDAQLLAIERHGDQMQRLFATAQHSESPICLTLDNRKIYIGYVVGMPLEPHDQYMSLVPIMSGYRDPATLTLRYTVDYITAFRKQSLNPADFVISVSMRNITHAGLFDPDLQAVFEIEEAQAKPEKLN